jgi:nitrogen fixation/metabolism regulation signal transduction histidine kinase
MAVKEELLLCGTVSLLLFDTIVLLLVVALKLVNVVVDAWEEEEGATVMTRVSTACVILLVVETVLMEVVACVVVEVE